MSLQGNILLIYGILVVLVLAVVVTIARSSVGAPVDYARVQTRAYALRRTWFWFLLGAVILAFVVTIQFLPYGAAEASGEATRYTVIARQYSFGGLPEVIPLGVTVVFEVTATDVNHGFAVYDPKGNLEGQVQAMPGYDNHLELTFDERGLYEVRCLEYCGINHHNMRASFEVR